MSALPTRYAGLADEKGERPAWQITRGKRSSQDHRQIWDLAPTPIPQDRHRGRPSPPSPAWR